MRLTKSQSRVLAVILIALFFVLGIRQVQKKANVAANTPATSSEESTPSQTATSSEIDPDSSFVLNDFQRSEVKEGKKVWEVKAAQGQYAPEKGTVILKAAILYVYKEFKAGQAERIELTADKAILHLDGSALKDADISGNVKVLREDGSTIETESAKYDKVKNLLFIPGFVQMHSPKMDLSGKKLTANLNTKELTLASDVSTTIQPRIE